MASALIEEQEDGLTTQVTDTDRNLLFWPAHVLNAARVKENWFPFSPSMAQRWQSGARGSRGKF
jgi:hypothetical protein